MALGDAMKRRKNRLEETRAVILRQQEILEAAMAGGAKNISNAPGPGMGLFANDEPEDHARRAENPPLDLGDDDEHRSSS